MGLYVADSAVKRVLEGENSDVGYITTDKNAIFPEASEEDYSFSYTGADQHWTAPFSGMLTIECKGAGSNNANGGYAKGTISVKKGQKFSIMVGGNGGRTNDGTTYGFGGSTTYGGRGGGGLSGVFTGDTAIGANDASRVVIIAGGAGGGRTGGGAGGGENGQNGNGGSYGGPGAGGTQTGRGSGGNTRSEQFRGGGGSGTYGFGGGGGWRGGNGSYGDGSGDDDAQAGGGSGHCSSKMTQTTLTVGGGAGANTDGSISFHLESKIIIPTPTKVTSAGVYHNPDLGLISISADGENWITISDKNVGATVADPEDTDSYGDIFQYGNIYHFDGEGSGGTVTTEAQIPDLTGYEGGNLYSNDKYRTNIDWNAANKKLWKPVAFANLLSLQKGPCDRGFHIPSAEEWTAVLNAILELEGEEAEFSYDLIARYLLMAHPNARKGDGDFYSSNTSIYFTNSYIENQNKINAFVMIGDEGDESGGLSATDMNCGGYVRGFRDVAMIPTTEWTKLGGGGITIRLPLAYQEVEYIESSGTSCGIDTGITPSNTSFFEIEFKMNPTTLKSSDNYFYGCKYTSNDWLSFEYTSNNGSYWNVGSSTLIGTLSPNLSTGTDYIFDCKYSGNNGGTFTVSGTYSKSVSYSGKNGSSSLYFFCAGNDLGSQSAEKLYYLKIYTGDSEANKSLVRDLVPCYRRIDGTIGMYDIVNKVFYANAGTGAFSKGADVNTPEIPNSYTEVEYLQSNGGGYIDTRIDKNEILTPFIRYEFYSDTSSTDCGFLGYRGNGTGGYIFGESQNQYRFTGGGTAGWQSSGISYSTGKHTFRTNTSNWYLDGTQGSGNGGNMNIYYGTLHLFRAGGGFGVPNGNVRVYSCLVGSSNDDLIHYYIPCLRNSDSKPGLYDLITKEFLVNGGTGEFTVGPRTKHAYQINENTKLYMPLTSEVSDLSGRATIANTGVTITNLNGVYCGNFNGSSRIETNIPAFTNINHTFVCWVKRNGGSGAGLICANPCGVFAGDVIYPSGDNKYIYQSYQTSSSGFTIESNTLNQSEWHCVVFTGGKLYVDGILQGSGNGGYTGGQVYTIGGHTTNSSCTRLFFTGYIAEVIIEDGVWTESQVVDYYNSTKNIFE